MLRKKRAILSLLLTLPMLLTGCFKSETVVTKVDPNKALTKLDGVPYSLPRTVVKAAIQFKRTEERPGPLEKFTPCFFPGDIADQRIREQSIAYSVEDPVFTYGVEPDPDEHYVVSVKGGFFEKKSLLLDFVPGGIISKGTAESSNEALEFTLKAIRTGTSIVTGFAGIPGTETFRLAMDTTSDEDANKVKDNLTEDEKSALECFKKKHRVAVQEKAEAEQAKNEAGKKNEGVKEALEAFEKAEKREKAAKEELDLVDEYLKQEAKERANPREANKEKQGGNEVAQDKGPRARRNKRSKRTTEAINIAPGSDGAVANNSPQENSNSTSRSSEGDNPFGEQTDKNGALFNKPLAPRTPKSDKDFKAERLLDGYQRAKETFEAIEELEKKRVALVSGGTNSDNLQSETLKEMLRQLNNSLEERNALFFGVSTDKPWTANFEFRPGKNLDEQTTRPLLWFAEDVGLCKTPESVEQGVLIPKNFTAKQCGSYPAQPPAGMYVVFLYLKRDTADQQFRNRIRALQQDFEDKRKKRGWYYRIPAKATVILMVGKLNTIQVAKVGSANLPLMLSGNDRVPVKLPGAEEVGRSLLDVAQLGITVSAPASGAGRTNQSTVEYDDFGALKNFKYASDPLIQQTALDEIQGTAQTIIDAKTKSNEAKKARNEAKAAADDPLTKMERELKLLETQNKINEEKKKLEQGNSSSDDGTP